MAEGLVVGILLPGPMGLSRWIRLLAVAEAQVGGLSAGVLQAQANHRAQTRVRARGQVTWHRMVSRARFQAQERGEDLGCDVVCLGDCRSQMASDL